MRYSAIGFHLGYSIICGIFSLSVLLWSRILIIHLSVNRLIIVAQLIGLGLYFLGSTNKQLKQRFFASWLSVPLILWGAFIIWLMMLIHQSQSMKLETEIPIGEYGATLILQGFLWILAGLSFIITSLTRMQPKFQKETETTRNLKKEQLCRKVLEAYLSTVGGGVQRFEMEIKKLEKTGLNREQAIHKIAEQLGM